MYFSNNSRCVLRKARFLSPNYFNKFGKSLSVKKPKDDPTKPPLRINIPDDDREDLFMKTKGAIEVKTKGTSLASYQDDVFQKSDEIHFSKVDTVFEDKMMGESTKESNSKTPGSDSYPFKHINLGNLDSNANESDEVSFEHLNNYNNANFASSKKVGKLGKEENFEEHGDQKDWFILLDVGSKNKDVEEKNSKESSNLQQYGLKNSFKKPEARMHKNFPLKSKHNSEFTRRKSAKKRSRFEVHEVEDEATYILYVRLNRQLQKKPCEVGYVPEKEFTIRTRSNHEHLEINENDFELRKHSELDKEKKKQKARKNNITIETLQEPEVKVETNSFEEYKEEKQNVNSVREKLFNDYEVASEGVNTPLTHLELSTSPEVTAEAQKFAYANTTQISAEKISGEGYTHPKQPFNLNVEKTKENFSAPLQSVKTTLEKSQKAEGFKDLNTDEVLSAETQKAYTDYYSAVKPHQTSKVETLATVSNPQASSMPFPTEDVTFEVEKQDIFSERKNSTAQQLNSNYEISISSKKEVKKQKNSEFQGEKKLADVTQELDHTVSVAENNNSLASEARPAETQTPGSIMCYNYDNSNTQNQSPPPPEPETKADSFLSSSTEKNKKEYLSIHHQSNEKSDKTPKNTNSPPKIWKASQRENSSIESSSTDNRDFQTCNSFVTIGRTETSTCSLTFGAAFPPLLKEALSTQLRLKNGFNEKWKSLSKDRNSISECNMRNFSENSILFPKTESDQLDCESLFTTKEQIILKIIKNDEESTMKSSEITKETDLSVDSLSMMKKVKEIVQLDLDNVVKIFDDGTDGKEISSVVVSTTNGWKVNQQELTSQMAMRRNEMKLELMDIRNNILGNENKCPLPKYLPSTKESPLEIQLPEEQTNSAIMFNPKNNEFFICKEALAEAISRKTNEPLHEITETLNFLAKHSKSAKDFKSGDSILVFDDETQSWKVDFSILEKRQQQLQLEEELTKTSELILEAFEELEKNQINVVPKPDTNEKKTFDYIKKEWRDIKNPNEKSIRPKHPFKDANAEEIRKKNSDLYENLFVAKKKETKMKTPEKKAPGVDSSRSKKESKSADSGEKKESSGDKSENSGPISNKPEVSESDSKPPPEKKIVKKENDNFWEEFLKMNILPKDISEIQKNPPKPVKDTEVKKPESKREVPSLKLPVPTLRRTPITKKEIEGDLQQDQQKKITPLSPPSNEKIEKPSVKVPPPSNQISKEEPKKSDLPKQVDVPKPNISKQPPKADPPKLDISKQPPKVDPPKLDISKQPPKVDPPKLDISKQPPKVDPPKLDTSKQPPKADPPKLDISKQPPKADPPKLDISKQPPKVDPPKPDVSKQPPKVDPPKPDISKQPPKVDPPKLDVTRQFPKIEPSKWDILKFPRRSPSKPDVSKQLPKGDPPKSDVSKTPKEDTLKSDVSKQPPKGDPPKSDTPKQTPKSDPPKPPSKVNPPKQPPKSDPPKEPSKPVTSNTSKVQDPKAPTGSKSASSPSDHYVSDKIIEISKTKGKEQPKTKTKIETVKLNITPDTKLPSKITEINLNKKFEKGGSKKETSTKKDSIKTSEESPKEKIPLYKKFEKYRTPFNDPEYEEKPMKIKSDIASNPNLKKLDNWNKTLVLHDIMKPPENIETWLKDETDKMATLLLKILQDASDGKPKKKQIPSKPKPGGKGNPYENIRKKQENPSESFLFRVRTVNLSLQNENKKSEDMKQIKSKKDDEISPESIKVVKPATIVDTVKLPMKKSSAPTARIPPILKAYHLPAGLEEQRGKSLQWGGESIGDFVPIDKESSYNSKLIIDVTEEIPGPEILKKISNMWKFLPILDSQLTVFTLLRVFQLVNLGRSFLSPLNSGKIRRTAFSPLFSKYGPVVNVKGPLSGNVILIHKPEHLAAVFEQDSSVFIRSVFDSLEQIRKDSDEKLIYSEVSTDWGSSEWTELKKLTNDTLLRGCEKYMAPAEISTNSLIGFIRKNRNSQDLVSEDFMEEIKRWSLEGLCSVLFEKSFGFMEGRITNMNWVLEPDKLYVAMEKATQSLNKCEGGFQLWRLMPTPSSVSLNQAYNSISAIFRKHIYQAGMNLKKKNELLKDGGGLFHLRDLTLIESMMLHDGLSNEEINCNLVDIMLIGTNMINSAVGFLLYNLALNVRAQSRLFQELKEALPSKCSHLDYNTLNSLKYLQACVKENFRLHMPIPLFYRMLQNDISLYNYCIPKGTYVVMDQRNSNQKEYLFENPEKFLPERWLNDEKWLLEYESVASFPLCHGPRADFAKKVMELQLYTFIAKILRNFHIEYHYGEIQSTKTLINFPDKPLKLNFIERES